MKLKVRPSHGRNLTLVTRNTTDGQGLKLTVINPWEDEQEPPAYQARAAYQEGPEAL